MTGAHYYWRTTLPGGVNYRSRRWEPQHRLGTGFSGDEPSRQVRRHYMRQLKKG